MAVLSATGAPIGFELIHSFGFPEGMGESPSAGVMRASDRNFYGTTVFGGTNGQGVVYRIEGQGRYRVLHHFGGASADGSAPVAALAEGAGILYGTTYSGGSGNVGTIFKVNLDGTGYAVLHHFGSMPNDGKNPQASITVGSEGKLYGVTRFGGMFDSGTVFTLNADGSGYAVIHDLAGPLDGRGTLVEISNRLYGTSGAGGPNGQGTVYRLNKDGSGLVVLRSFEGSPSDGSGSWAGLLVGRDGAVYGTSPFGGSSDRGTVFKLNPDGSGYQVLHHFGAAGDGEQPWSSLAEDAADRIYGVARNGGTYNNGVAFRLNNDGTGYERLHDFNGGAGDGYRPEGTVLYADGVVYGTARLGGAQNIGTVFKCQPDGSGYSTLHSFLTCGGDGIESGAQVLAASDGYLYGTTLRGGAYDFGVIYRVRPDGSDYQVLHEFEFYSGDGVNPYEGLIESRDGMLYGATRYGGGVDVGTVFKLNKDGAGYTIIHRFTNVPGTGRYPVAGVIEGSDGKLYGRTISGGLSGGFTIFSMGRDGADFQILYDAPWPNGSIYDAYANLIEGSDGALYGTGYEDGNDEAGTVFKINKDGTAYRVLHHFNYTNGDGYNPESGVIEANDGKLYGTTTYGGEFDSGVVFRVDKEGSGYTILHEFEDPYYPVGNFHEGPGGVLYGVTYFGGADDAGSLYIINRDGSGFAVLHEFTSGPLNGYNPNSSLVRGSDRASYGTTIWGGSFDCGCIYRLAPISLRISREASGYRLHITGAAGQRYAIDRADNLSSEWALISTADNATGTVEFLDSTPNSQKFYRCRLLLP